ncbi:membrane-associated protein [Aeromonas sp. BIGb0405]|jgi:membrane-associated protein|uniref:DedA family protein n=1 Tax=Aeromonas TaxID=642 RepID=UPI001CCBCCE2|nr:MULTISPECIES: DedA family protein [Aeromonas]MCS3454078.1 membrane-associated protein [Aeromonas sp. BIGb0405]MCS3459957.1 membrane-associated protein [Aeromonas sp. BIGb0445]UBO75639.1 DedA family protein [Aeromonas rivuli]
MDLILFLVDFILHIDIHLKALFADYGVWIYAILFLIIFCETGLVVMPFLPGDSLLFAAGALTVDSALDVHLLSALLVLAAILGDLTNYTLGRLFGERLFSRPDSRLFRQDYLHQTHAFFDRHGGKAIIIARFAPIVRTFAPFVAGMGKMSYPRFMAFNAVGGLCWVLSFVYVGHFFGNLPLVKENFTLLIFVIIGISLLPMVIAALRARLGKG